MCNRERRQRHLAELFVWRQDLPIASRQTPCRECLQPGYLRQGTQWCFSCRINVPVAILINKNTASSAEVVAGALQARNRAVLIGATTFGKGSVQESLKLANRSSIEITVGRLRTPLGKFIEGTGIKPDLVASEMQSLPKAINLINALSDILKPADQKSFPKSTVQSSGNRG